MLSRRQKERQNTAVGCTIVYQNTISSASVEKALKKLATYLKGNPSSAISTNTPAAIYAHHPRSITTCLVVTYCPALIVLRNKFTYLNLKLCTQTAIFDGFQTCRAE